MSGKYPGHHPTNINNLNNPGNRGFPQLNNHGNFGNGPTQVNSSMGQQQQQQQQGYPNGRGQYPPGRNSNTGGSGYNANSGQMMGGYQGYSGNSNMQQTPQMMYPHQSQHNTPSHSPYSSSPTPSHLNISTGKGFGSAPLRRYVLVPPPKKQRLHRTSDLGFPGIFPQMVGQEEDQLTEHNVRSGYMDKGIIQNETVSAHGILADGLQDPKVLADLGSFMVEVLKKRLEANRITRPSTFRPPIRATLNDQKREQWISDLAGNTPLRKLSKNVPHGFKGDKLLEALAQRQVPLMRATWYIKIVALGEMQNQRTRTTTSQQQYSTDWTQTVNGFLKKQLSEINPQPTARPALSTLSSVGGPPPKPWSSVDSKEKWEAKWRYSINLTKWQYSEGLLDHRSFLRATVEMGQLCFEQVSLLLSLITLFLPEYGRSRLLMRLLIENLLSMLQQVQNHPQYDKVLFRYTYLEQDLKRMLQAIFLSSPDMFVIPKAWMSYRPLLHQVLLEDLKESNTRPTVFPNAASVFETHFCKIKSRVQVFTELSNVETTSDSDQQVSRIAMLEDLDVLDHSSDVDEMARKYFDSASTTTEWTCLVFALCEWAVISSRYGNHRIYLASTFLTVWKEELALEISAEERSSMLQQALLSFLNQFSGTVGHGNEEYDAISRLFGKLIQDRHFSYQLYLRRLIARGDLQPSKRTEDTTLRHLKYLETFPLHHSQPHHLNQRRVVLFGVDGRDDQDTNVFSEITGLVKAKLPYIFCPDAENRTFPHKDVDAQDLELSYFQHSHLTDRLRSASRFCQLRVSHEWLLEAVKSYVVKHIQIGEDNWRVMTSPGSSLLNIRQFVTLVRIMEVANDFQSLCEMTLWVLDKTAEKSLMPAVLSVIRKHQTIWVAMGVLTKMSQAVLNKHYSFQAKRITCKALPRFLANEAHNVPEDIRQQMASDAASATGPLPIMMMSSSHSGGGSGQAHWVQMPLQLAELHSLADDPTASNVSKVAGSLWSRYGTNPEWQVRILEASVETLRRTMDMSKSLYDTCRITRAFVELIVDMAERGSSGCLDEAVLAWTRLQIAGWRQARVEHQSSYWNPLCETNTIWFVSFLVQLVVQGLCSVEILVERYCAEVLADIGTRLSALTEAETAIAVSEGSVSAAASTGGPLSLKEINTCVNIVLLLHLLLIQDTSVLCGSGPGIKLNTFDIHALQAQRVQLQKLDRMDAQFRMLRQLVLIETALPLNHQVLHEVQAYRKDLIAKDWFREVCLRNVEIMYRRFLKAGGVINNLTLTSLPSALSASSSLQPPSSQGSHQAVRPDRSPLEREVDRKVLETLQSILADDSNGVDALNLASRSSPGPAVYVQVLRGIFSRTNPWIFDRCRVEFWLLMDSVLIIPAVTGSSNSIDGGFSGNAEGMMMDDDIDDEDVSMDPLNHHHNQLSRQLHRRNEGQEEAVTPEECLRQLANCFFYEFVLTGGTSKDMLGKMLKDLRKDVVEEFIKHGYAILATGSLSYSATAGISSSSASSSAVLDGPPTASFPLDIMITLDSGSSAEYERIAAGFHHVMEILLKESINPNLAPPPTPAPAHATPSGSQNSLPSKSGATASSVSASVASASPSGPSLMLTGLDQAQVESRIQYAKSILWQLKRFEDRLKIFDVMHALGISYGDAVRACAEDGAGGHAAGTGASGAGDFNDTEENEGQQQQQQPAQEQGSAGQFQQQPQQHHRRHQRIMLMDIRTSLCLRFRLLVPLLPVILQNMVACDMVTYVLRLTNLLVNCVVHGNGSEERLFEFCLDMVSCLMDEVLLNMEVPNDLRKEILNSLRTNLPHMTIPPIFASRIYRILPFQQHNVYFSGLRNSLAAGGVVVGPSGAVVSTGGGGGGGGIEIQNRPYDWLEDCTGATDQDGSSTTGQANSTIAHTPGSGPSGAVGAVGAGGASANIGSGGGSTGSLAGDGQFGGPNGLSGAGLNGSLGGSGAENVNDTAISLTLFGAKHIRKGDTGGTTYQDQFRLGHGSFEDYLLPEELEQFMKANQVMQQREQQQQQQKDDEGGNHQGDISRGSSSGREGASRTVGDDIFMGMQEPDQELEEGQILGEDDDMDMTVGGGGMSSRPNSDQNIGSMGSLNGLLDLNLPPSSSASSSHYNLP